MENRSANRLCSFDSGVGVVCGGSLGEPARRQDDADRRLRRWRFWSSSFEKKLGQVSFEAVHQSLGLGIAEPNIELERLRTAGRHHESGIEKTREWHSFVLHGCDGGQHDAIHDL